MAVTAALLVVSAGCLGVGDDEEESSADATGDAEASLPSPIYDQRTVRMETSPLGTSQGEPCQTEASNCYRYAFQASTETQIQARLDWSNATNDFDLHVMNTDGETVASSNNGGASTQERIDTTLEPGSYELIVVAWLVPQDTYQLEAQFGYP